MISFFVPIGKVQKDRRIMRDVDLRMAKYSRRGLLFNFCAFLICLIGGRFVNENRDLTIVLSIGLLVVTFLRGFFLFRFETLYPRAPRRWRNNYFMATLLGAIWWGVILFSVTLKLELEDEAPLLWLYTVVFFSSTAHAFAPYQKFLSYYQFIGLVPAAIAALLLDDFTSYVYGVLMVFFYIVLNHQCRLISANYWERLEATYALVKKAESVEEEKRDNKASADLNREFLSYLNNDLKRLLSEVHTEKQVSEKVPHARVVNQGLQPRVERLYQDVKDFSDILSKEMVLASSVFNIRHELQHIVAEYVDGAAAKEVIIESSLSPTLPMRLRGDPSRFAQVVRSMLSVTLHGMSKGLVLVEAEFLREYEYSGELYITVSRLYNNQKKSFATGESQACLPATNLSLALAKGIADVIKGSLEVNEIAQGGQKINFNGKFDIAEHLGQLDFHRNSFLGHSILLIHQNAKVVDVKRRELEALGFDVYTETQYKRAQQLLVNSYKQDKRIESVLYYLDDADEQVKEFNMGLCEHADLKFTHQIIAASESQKNHYLENGYCLSEYVHFIDKPVGLFELELTFRQAWSNSKTEDVEETENSEEVEEEVEKQAAGRIMLLSHQSDTLEIVEKRLAPLGYEMILIEAREQIAPQLLEGDLPSVILVDCDDELNFISDVGKIRQIETDMETEGFLPILGLSSALNANDVAAYELGIDDFIELNKKEHNLAIAIEFWASLGPVESN